MKKLKTYKLFLESNSEHIDEVIGVLNDMCLELRDEGFVVDPLYMVFSKPSTVVVSVIKSGSDGYDPRDVKRFFFDDIKESILQMIEYMESEGFSIKKVEFVDVAGLVHNAIIKDGLLITKCFYENDVNVDHLIANFIISFNKSNKTNESLSERPIGSESEYDFEEDKNFISDTLLELEDKGYKVKISPDGISNNISIDDPMPYFIIQNDKYFKFSDVKEELLQIKSYLGDRWFKCGVIFEGDPIRIEIYIDEKGYDHLDDWFQTSTTAIVNLAVFFNI